MRWLKSVVVLVSLSFSDMLTVDAIYKEWKYLTELYYFNLVL